MPFIDYAKYTVIKFPLIYVSYVSIVEQIVIIILEWF